MTDLIDEAVAVSEAERAMLIARASDQVAQAGTIHCEQCDVEIPEARRVAAPFATRCIHCQTRFERGF